MTANPRLSVVIASLNAGSLLRRCVEALGAQAASQPVELIVVRALDRPADADRQGLAARVPELVWIDAPAGSTVPQLRGLGIAAARGNLIALLEDDCEVAPDWCRIAMAGSDTVAAVGGAVEPGAYRRALDWAVYFCEYGRFMLPLPGGPDAPLPGNNVVYSRPAIAALQPASRAEFREVFVHAAWRLAGVPTCVNEALVVRNVNAWTREHVTSAPFHHGRAYAAQRFGGRPAPVRAAIALLIFGLPVLKVTRIVAGTIARRRLVGQLVLALPWMMVFLVSWSAGELAGCLAGPGNSPSRWR